MLLLQEVGQIVASTDVCRELHLVLDGAKQGCTGRNEAQSLWPSLAGYLKICNLAQYSVKRFKFKL